MDHSFQVQGMTCGHCDKTIKRAIARLDTEAEVEIDRSIGRIDVQSNQARDDIAHAIAEEGYQVTWHC